MPKKRPTTRAERAAKNPAMIANRFEPTFLEDLDQRLSVVKTIKRNMQRLTEEANCDSVQKQMLAKRAVFIAIQLETMECEAIRQGEIDFGPYVQAVNALQGILVKLGVDRQTTDKLSQLEDYVASR